MILEHFLALIPLMFLMVFSIVWYGKGIIQLMTLGYSLILAFIAISGSWELLFYPICLGTGIIAIILFWYSMVNGDWL